MLRILFLAIAGIVIAGSAQSQRLINKAAICFDNKGARGLIAGNVMPIGCFSSSCTRVTERQVSIGVNSATGIIRVTTRFVLTRTGAKICTADCSGGGRSTFDYRFFPPRIYKVLIGDKEVGELDLRLAKVRTCFRSPR